MRHAVTTLRRLPLAREYLSLPATLRLWIEAAPDLSAREMLAVSRALAQRDRLYRRMTA